MNIIVRWNVLRKYLTDTMALNIFSKLSILDVKQILNTPVFLSTSKAPFVFRGKVDNHRQKFFVRFNQKIIANLIEISEKVDPLFRLCARDGNIGRIF